MLKISIIYYKNIVRIDKIGGALDFRVPKKFVEVILFALSNRERFLVYIGNQ